MKWTLIVLGLIVVVSMVVAITGVGGSDKTNSGRNSRPSTGPGSRSDPIPIGKAAAVGGGWSVKVVRVTPNATKQVAAANRYDYRPPPRGARDFMVLLKLTYSAGGKGDAGLLLLDGLHAMGAHRATYETSSDSCAFGVPKPDLEQVGAVFSGQSVQGNVCFQIAENDAASLMLYSCHSLEPNSFYVLTNIKRVWFSLH